MNRAFTAALGGKIIPTQKQTVMRGSWMGKHLEKGTGGQGDLEETPVVPIVKKEAKAKKK